MKIRITQTIIEFDFDDQRAAGPQTPSGPAGGRPSNHESSRKSFSFFDLLRKEAEKAMFREHQEEKFHGQFLP